MCIIHNTYVWLPQIFQVSSNGLITFRIPFTNSDDESFSDRFALFQDAIIAPFWTDFNLAGSARLFYRVSRASSDLTAAADLIADPGYTPTLVVVVTWENVPVANNQSSTVSVFIMYQLSPRQRTHTLGSYIVVDRGSFKYFPSEIILYILLCFSRTFSMKWV